MDKINVYTLKGTQKDGKIELPRVFGEKVRNDIVKRAVVAAQSTRYQPKGVDWYAGKRTSAEGLGVGQGLARLPRVKGSRHPAAGRGAVSPMAVGGRAAHPPVTIKRIVKRINKKERRKALASAIAATAMKELVEARGHVIADVPQIPMVVDDELEGISVASEIREAFTKLGLWGDIMRAKVSKVRSGKGKMRGRRYKKKKSVLIVVGKDRGISRGAGNYTGIDVVEAGSLGVEDLAPGTQPGRLTVYSESAIQKLGEIFQTGEER